MIYYISGYIITLVGCTLLIYYSNNGLTIRGLLCAIICSCIPIFGQVLALLGVLDHIDRTYTFSLISKILNKKLL